MATAEPEQEAEVEPSSSLGIFAEKRKAVFHDAKKARQARLPVRRKLSEGEREAASRVPLDMLAREWLNDHRATLETRSYLVEKLLPTLVVGLEKLLREVTARELVYNMEPQEDFNPINFVAQYLMRNNPRYSNFAEAHPYCLTMKRVLEELKRMAYSVDENKLAELKARSRQRCQARAEEEARKANELKRRMEVLAEVYPKWLFDKELTVNVVEIKNALLSWIETLTDSELQATLRARLTAQLSEVTCLTWTKIGFSQAVVEFASDLSAAEFNQLAALLELWGLERVKNKQREKWRELFSAVFDSCDPNGTGSIDRLRILYLLDKYYDDLSDEEREALRNPRQWPIMDVVEVEELEEDEDTLASEAKLASLSPQDLREFYEELEEERGRAGEGGARAEEGGAGTEEGWAGEGEGEARGEGGPKRGEGSLSVDAAAGRTQDRDTSRKEVTSAGSEVTTSVEVEVSADIRPTSTDIKIVSTETTEARATTAGGATSASTEVKSTSTEIKSASTEVQSAGGGLRSQFMFESKERTTTKSESRTETKAPKPASPEPASPELASPEPMSTEITSASTKIVSASTDQEPPSTDIKSVSSDEKSLSSEVEGTSEGQETRRSTLTNLGSLLERRVMFGRSRDVSLLRMREVCGMNTQQPLVPSGPGAIWDHEKLNRPQFLQLVELFVGREPDQELVESVAAWIRDNYTETENERLTQVTKAQQQAVYVTKRRKVKSLFETWDNNSSGFLDLEELQDLICKWRAFSDEKGREQVKAGLDSLGVEGRLSRLQFQTYIDRLTQDMNLEECAQFFEFLFTNLKLSLEEEHRGEKRKEFLSKITLVGKTSGLNFLPAAKEAISVLHKDVEMFGDSKHVTVSISLLTPTLQYPETLVVKAATPAIEPRILKSKVHRNSGTGVGFKAVDNARPVHILSIQKNSKVAFFLPEHKSSRYDGSLVVVPIVTPQQVVLGTINIDSLQPAHTDAKTNFYAHEVNFFQGVGLCLGEVQHWISVHQKLLKVAQSALEWVHRRCQVVSKGEVYIVQPDQEGGEDGEGYLLSLMLSTSGSQLATENINKKLRYHENQFFDYLFECVDLSEPVSATVYGQHHLAYPIRDHTGCAVALVDLTMPSAHSLSPQQLREITKVLKLLTAAFYKLSSSSCSPQQAELNEKEKDVKVPREHILSAKSDHFDGDASMSVLFDQLMLSDLKDKVKRIDKKSFAEFRSYVEPPLAVLQVIRALLYIIYPQQEFETWAQCKPNITVSLVKALETYDPLQVKCHPKLELIKQLMLDLPVSSLQEHGSLPAKYLYDWVLVCVPLLEYANISAPLSTTISAPLTATPSQSSTIPLPSTVSVPMPTSATLTPLPSSAVTHDNNNIASSISAPLPSTN